MSFKVITQNSLKQEKIQTRIDRILKSNKLDKNPGIKEAIVRELESGSIPRARFAEDFDFNKVTKKSSKSGAVREFIGTGNFASDFYERQRYEVDAGRDMEPLLYPAIYSVMVDASLPRLIPINTLGTTGVVFEKIEEGGEVKFATVGQGTKSVEINHYGVGIEYNEDLFMYNELWRLATLERNFGTAHNALLNHIHMDPILSYSYAAKNQTAASSTGTTLVEKYLRTIEAAITDASTDQTDPRSGPYALLVSNANLFTVERALNRVPQQGFDMQSSALSRVQSIVAYDGWSGTRGKKSFTYDGVAANKAYLISLNMRDIDFQSYFKHELRRSMGNEDVSRFILEQVIYDVRFGVFADPKRAVQEITWPTS